MKKLIFLLLIFISVVPVNAQQNSTVINKQKDTMLFLKDSAMKSYVSMQARQLIVVQNDKVSRLTKNLTLKNGTIVQVNGTVKTADGKTFQLKEGDRVYMNGLVEGLAKPVID